MTAAFRALQVPSLLARALQQMLDSATGGADLLPILLPAAATASAPALLARQAAQAPAKGRPVPQADNVLLYGRCLALYRERVQPGAALDDLGRAAALFVMANLGALGRAEGCTSATLDALTQQMQNALQRLADWPATDLVAQQQLFEQLALLSVLITQSSEAAATQGPSARANVRLAAQAYLRQWLTLDPALVSLSASGLVVAPTARATLARQLHRATLSLTAAEAAP